MKLISVGILCLGVLLASVSSTGLEKNAVDTSLNEGGGKESINEPNSYS